jgi:hypothetical protein
MDAFGVLKGVDDYENFVKGFPEIKDDQIQSMVEKEIGDGLRWPGSWLALNPAFESGGTASERVKDGVLAPEATSIFRDPVGNEIPFHRHQADALRAKFAPTSTSGNLDLDDESNNARGRQSRTTDNPQLDRILTRAAKQRGS